MPVLGQSWPFFGPKSNILGAGSKNFGTLVSGFQVAVVGISLSSGTHPLTVGDRGKGVTGREAVKVAADTAGAACVHLRAGGEEHAGAAQECVVEVVPGVRLARGGVTADSSTFLLCLHSCHST